MMSVSCDEVSVSCDSVSVWWVYQVTLWVCQMTVEVVRGWWCRWNTSLSCGIRWSSCQYLGNETLTREGGRDLLESWGVFDDICWEPLNLRLCQGSRCWGRCLVWVTTAVDRQLQGVGGSPSHYSWQYTLTCELVESLGRDGCEGDGERAEASQTSASSHVFHVRGGELGAILDSQHLQPRTVANCAWQ